MILRIIVLEPVADELTEATHYYNNIQYGLGLKLLDEWESSIRKIQQSPEGYQKKYKNYRQVLLNKFPYLIVYSIDKTTIIVSRFINVRKHPKKRYLKQ